MDRFLWSDIYGPIFMDRCLWTDVCGPMFMDRCLWTDATVVVLAICSLTHLLNVVLELSNDEGG